MFPTYPCRWMHSVSSEILTDYWDFLLLKQDPLDGLTSEDTEYKWKRSIGEEYLDENLHSTRPLGPEVFNRNSNSEWNFIERRTGIIKSWKM